MTRPSEARSEHEPVARKVTLGVPLGEDWLGFLERLTAFLSRPERRLLVLSDKASPFYVQVSLGGIGGGHAEAVSDSYLPDDHKLSPSQLAALPALGWKPPTGSPEDPRQTRGPGWNPNFRLPFDAGMTWAEVARVMVGTLASVFGVSGPARLEYHAMDGARNCIRAPELGLEEYDPSDARNRHAVLSRWFEHLARMGFRPSGIGPRSVSFRFEGLPITVVAADEVPRLARLEVSYGLPPGLDGAQVDRLALQVQEGVPQVKVCPRASRDVIDFTVELVVGNELPEEQDLRHCFLSLRSAWRKFVMAVRPV